MQRNRRRPRHQRRHGLIQLRAKDSRTSDPTFPPMTNGTFDEAAVLAWRADRDAEAAPAANPTPLEK